MTDQNQTMPPSKMGMGDSVEVAMARVREAKSNVPIGGNVIVELFDREGVLKYYEIGENLVTDYGDEHVGERMYDDTALIVTGMRLGDDTTPPTATKAGAGSAIQTYLTGSNEDLDATAVGSDKGAGAGWRVQHICTWVAGDITDPAISEVVLSDETPLTDVAGASGNTVAKFIFASTIDKQAGDQLVVTWNVDFLGA